MEPSRPGSVCPSDGRTLSPVTWTDPKDVDAVVAKARSAQRDWGSLSLKQRGHAVQSLARRVLEGREEILDIMGEEMGRGRADSLLSELTVIMNYAKGSCKVAKQALKSESVSL